MKIPFNSASGSIVVKARVGGLRGSQLLELVLDTGAEYTVLNPEPLLELGLATRKNMKKVRLVTASGIVFGTKVLAPRITALGQTRTNFELVALSMPRDVASDGVMGLDFFRGFNLNINFKTGYIELK
jgi:predicted aspartyl protease